MDLISRQAAIDAMKEIILVYDYISVEQELDAAITALINLPSAQPTLYGYNIEHLEMIARILQKENLPPEKITEVLTDIDRIVAIVKDEFEKLVYTDSSLDASVFENKD